MRHPWRRINKYKEFFMPPVRPKGFGKPKDTKKTISRILSYMGKFKALWLVVFVCVLISSGASVAGGMP